MTVGNAKGAIGFETMSMRITGTDAVYAYGKDSMSRDVKVPILILPAKSPAPAVGDEWLISKRNGTWNFIGIKNNPAPPTVTGQTDDPALWSLLEGLETQGYVVNDATQTTGWTAYTPVWTASVSNPSIGNGALIGRYQIVSPKTCAVRLQLSVGSTTALGSGFYTFTLPIASSSILNSVGGAVNQVGTGLWFSSTGVAWQVTWIANAGSATSVFYGPTTSGNVAQIAWGSGNISAGSGSITAAMVYETI